MKTPRVIMSIPREINGVKFKNSDLGGYDHKKKVIHIRRTRFKREQLDTAIHESLHHADPSLSESKVARYAGVITAVLWDVMGYRQKKKIL